MPRPPLLLGQKRIPLLQLGYVRMIQYNKLVRDRIPEIIQKSGRKCHTRILADEEYVKELTKKLHEEVKEFTEQPNLEELADILEIINALAEILTADIAKVEDIRKQKALDRGTFKDRIFLEWVD